MAISIRAIYHQGTLQLLTPVDLVEGQEIEFEILSEQEKVDRILAPYLVHVPDTDEEIDEEALLAEVAEELKGQPPISEIIIQERREGP